MSQALLDDHLVVGPGVFLLGHRDEHRWTGSDRLVRRSLQCLLHGGQPRNPCSGHVLRGGKLCCRERFCSCPVLLFRDVDCLYVGSLYVIICVHLQKLVADKTCLHSLMCSVPTDDDTLEHGGRGCCGSVRRPTSASRSLKDIDSSIN